MTPTEKRALGSAKRSTAIAEQRVFAIILLGVAATLAGCSESKPPAGPILSNVLLVTIDTLRADRTGPYRVDSNATPTIAKLAAEGTLFEAAMSPMQMTRPSHYSLFTSLYPRDHGVVNNKISLEPEFQSVAEVFRENGYQTAGFVGVTLLGPDSGAERGFDHFDYPSASRTRPAEQIVGAATSWLKTRDQDKPYFVWVHLFDPHTPYSPARGFVPKARNNAASAITELSIEQIIIMAKRNGGDLAAAVVERAGELYQGDIEYADYWLGKLLDEIDGSGTTSVDAKQRTVVALTADHGECFENGIYFEHSDCLYEGAARIPLIFRFPRRVAQNVRRAEVVEILDVAPTLLGLVDIPAPEAFSGRDLFDAEAPARGAAFLQHPLYSNTGVHMRTQRRLRSVMGMPTRPILIAEELLGVRTEEWKYLRHGTTEELYHLPSDPGETRNVAGKRVGIARKLRGKLDAWSAAHPQHHTSVEQINDELRATLEALGYLQ